MEIRKNFIIPLDIVMHKSGFTLLECSLYLLAMMMISLLSAQWIAQAIQVFYARKSQDTSLIIAADYIQTDCTCMQSGFKLFKPQEIIGRIQDKDVGWSLEKGKLIRKDGSYNSVQKKWITYSSTVVATNIKELKFSTVQSKRKQLIFKLIGQQAQVEQSITIRNGTV